MDKEYIIDLQGVKARSDLHDRIEQGLPVPGWYGRNLDALYDVLTEPQFGDGCLIIFLGCRDFMSSMPGYFKAMRQMCLAAAEENSGMTVEFLE